MKYVLPLLLIFLSARAAASGSELPWRQQVAAIVAELGTPADRAAGGLTSGRRLPIIVGGDLVQATREESMSLRPR